MTTPRYRCDLRRPHSPHTHWIAGTVFACPGVNSPSLSRRAPQNMCAGGCGRRVFRAYTFCDRCQRTRPAAPDGQESILQMLRRRNGQCVVCGGPYPDGSGCEFCPKVESA